jgi:hypothetical protein
MILECNSNSERVRDVALPFLQSTCRIDKRFIDPSVSFKRFANMEYIRLIARTFIPFTCCTNQRGAREHHTWPRRTFFHHEGCHTCEPMEVCWEAWLVHTPERLAYGLVHKLAHKPEHWASRLAHRQGHRLGRWVCTLAHTPGQLDLCTGVL